MAMDFITAPTPDAFPKPQLIPVLSSFIPVKLVPFMTDPVSRYQLRDTRCGAYGSLCR